MLLTDDTGAIRPDVKSLLGEGTKAAAQLDALARAADWALQDRYIEDGTVALRGYDPDPAQCDAELLARYMYVGAQLIEFFHARPAEFLSASSRGDRSESYTALRSVPARVWRLLRHYDEREEQVIWKL